MTLEAQINEMLPEHWWVVTISSLDSVNAGSGWLVQLCDGEMIATGIAETIEYAIEECSRKIEIGQLSGRLAILAHSQTSEAPKLNLAGLLPKAPPIRRRA